MGVSGEGRRKGETYSKMVLRLPGFEGGLGNEPTPQDFVRLVTWGIDLLEDRRWRLYTMIPRSSVRIVDDRSLAWGFKGFIDMDFIQGERLSEMEIVPLTVGDQLADFLFESFSMATITKQELGRAFIPDLLAGVRNSHDMFCNFLVEEDGDLWFVDVFPVVSVGWRQKRKYVRNLRKAADRIGQEGVVKETERLITAL